ncbi:hypothetical protein T484DRAFT_1807938 [Baffinella frigidus]|nr:hypothetical protein T484DRAFT_1807938 [Cryptophyta sp. CCMP2293]
MDLDSPRGSVARPYFRRGAARSQALGELLPWRGRSRSVDAVASGAATRKVRTLPAHVLPSLRGRSPRTHRFIASLKNAFHSVIDHLPQPHKGEIGGRPKEVDVDP